MLHDLAELTVLEEGDVQSFKVRAYESAARAVEGYVGDITKLTAKELEKIEGIGKSTAAKIRELLDSGKVQKLEGLRQKHPASVMAMMRIPGLGPKAVNRLRKELGVESVSDLRKAIADQKLRGMRIRLEIRGEGRTLARADGSCRGRRTFADFRRVAARRANR
jgi:DNA polymerase (family 10)